MSKSRLISNPTFGLFFMIFDLGSPDYIAKSAIFNFWHEITLYAIDIDKIRSITPFLNNLEQLHCSQLSATSAMLSYLDGPEWRLLSLYLWRKKSRAFKFYNLHEQCGDQLSFWNTAQLLTDTIGLVLCSRPPTPAEADNSLPRPSPWAYPTLTYLYLDL